MPESYRPLDIEVIERAPKLPADHERFLLDLAAWRLEDSPQCIVPGTRTGWVQIGEGRAWRIKGMGHKTYGENPETTQPKCEEAFQPLRRVIRLQYGFEGSLRIVGEPGDPFAGWNLSSARQEWRAAQRAFRAGVPVAQPGLLIKYPRLRWGLSEMPLAAMAVMERRAHYSRLIDDWFKLYEQEITVQQMCDIQMSKGHSLRLLHEQARTAYIQGHEQNFSCEENPKATSPVVIIHDLEQAIHLEELPHKKARGMHRVYDLYSCLNGIFLQFSLLEDEAKYKVVLAFLVGYFGVNGATVDEDELIQFARKAVEMHKRIERFFEKDFGYANTPQKRGAKVNFIKRELWPALFLLYKKSTSVGQDPVPNWDKNQFMQAHARLFR